MFTLYDVELGLPHHKAGVVPDFVWYLWATGGIPAQLQELTVIVALHLLPILAFGPDVVLLPLLAVEERLATDFMAEALFLSAQNPFRLGSSGDAQPFTTVGGLGEAHAWA
jgi:hypothetical protein